MEILRGVGTTTGATHAWILDSVLPFLQPIDTARLVIAELESGSSSDETNADTRARVHGLRYGASPLPPIDQHVLLGEAASHGCWCALAVLLEDLMATSPPWVTLHADPLIKDESRTADRAMQRATRAHYGTHYRFGTNVLQATATRGDLPTLQWLLPRSGPKSQQIKPVRRPKPSGRQSFCPPEVVRAAAEARQLHVVNWIVTHAPELHCVLAYDDELRAVCWIERNSHDPQWCFLYCATSTHGFSSAHSRFHADADGITKTGMSDMPLADGFARDGDLASLQAIYARDNYRQLMGPNALREAATHGHLDVIEWLYERFPETLSSSCVVGAASRGHLHVMQWLQQFPEHFGPSFILNAASAGHLHVLQWCRSVTGGGQFYHQDGALEAAVRNGHIDVVRFLHKECGAILPLSTALIVLPKCPSIEVFDYVLSRFPSLPGPDHFVKQVAFEASFAVVKHLILQRGLWSRRVLHAVVNALPSSPGAATKLETSLFVYAHAHGRAQELGTSLREQLDCAGTSILQADDTELAVWLLDCVPEMKVWSIYKPVLNEQCVTNPIKRSVLRACVLRRPTECHSVPWLPVWAAQANCFEALEIMDATGHPTLRDHATYQAVMTHTRDARMMRKLLPLPQEQSSLYHDVVEWAARFGMVSVLQRVWDCVEGSAHTSLLQRVAFHVGVSGHVEMGDWLLAQWRRLGASQSKAVKDIRVHAVRRGHTAVLRWLQQHELLSSRPQELTSLILEAASARHIWSLQWLLSNLPVPTKLVTRALVHAVRHQNVEIVAWLTTQYEPSDLPVDSQTHRRISALLRQLRITRGTGTRLPRQLDHGARTRSCTKRARLT